MKTTASFLVVAIALIVAVVVYSCSQQENAPTSSNSPDGGLLSKPAKSDLVDQGSLAVVGSAAFAPGTGQLKITVSLTDALASTTFYVSYNYAGGCAYNSGNIDTITTDARGRARFTEILTGTGSGTSSFGVQISDGFSTNYLSDCVTVTIK